MIEDWVTPSLPDSVCLTAFTGKCQGITKVLKKAGIELDVESGEALYIIISFSLGMATFTDSPKRTEDPAV